MGTILDSLEKLGDDDLRAVIGRADELLKRHDMELSSLISKISN